MDRHLYFDASRPKVGQALRILRLSRTPKDVAELRRRCAGLFVTGTPEEGGDTWISDSMHAAERTMAADAYRWLRDRIQAAQEVSRANPEPEPVGDQLQLAILAG